ncbi:MAG: SdrD B-like domain-containing protein [Saprospiraceae bacterium]
MQIIKLVDEINPSIDCPDDIIDLGCNPTLPTIQDAISAVNTDDNCGVQEATAIADEIHGDCEKTQMFTVTVTDNCGNSASCIVTYKWTVSQLTMTCPSDRTLQSCSTQSEIDNAFAQWKNSLTFGGGCNPTLSVSNESAPDACDGGNVTVTFTVTDDCDTKSCTATFSVTKATDVAVSCPSNMTVDGCMSQSEIDAAYASWLSSASVSGGCDPVLTNNAPGQSPRVCDGGTVTVTFTGDDRNGCDSDQCTATFTVTAAPAITMTCPSDRTLQSCSTQSEIDNAFAQWKNSVTFGGGCNPTLSVSNESAPDACDGGNVTVTFTVTDDCDTKSCTATFSVDAPAPLIVSCPGDVRITACTSQDEINNQFNNWLSSFNFSGGCNAFTLSDGLPTPPNVCDGGVVEFEYIVVDDCGTKSCSSRFTVPSAEDRLELIGVPADATVSCNDDVTPATVTAKSQCSDNVQVNLSTITLPGTCPVIETITYTWTAIDECGNDISASQTITVRDDEVPVLPDNLPQDVVVNCEDDVPSPANLVATDKCNGDIPGILSENTIPGSCPNDFEIIRTWIFDDGCTNIATHRQRITVRDEINPVWESVPSDLRLDCNDNIPSLIQLWLDNGGNGNATDNCGDVTISNNYTNSVLSCINDAQIVTFIATDECGNSATSSATISFSDDTPPNLTNLSNRTITCNEDPIFDTPVATDDCDTNVDLSFTESGNFGICKDGSMTRVWTATDDCGNTSTVSQTITRNEQCGQDDKITNETICSDELPFNFFGQSINAPGRYSSQQTDANGCPYTEVLNLTVTPKPSDEVTNVTICSDELPYTWNGRTYNGSDTDRIEGANCTADLVLNLTVTPKPSDEVTNVTICSDELPYTWNGRTYNGSDTDRIEGANCTADLVLNLTVIDGCTIVTQASDLNLVCGRDNVVGMIQDWLNSNGGMTISCTNVNISSNYNGSHPDCDNSVKVTFSYIDECGINYSSSAYINLVDDTAPVIQNAPENISVSCSAPSGSSLTAIDACAGTLTANPVDVRTDGNCPNRYVINRTWSFSDECGNSITHTQIINVTDDESPVITNVPVNVDVDGLDQIPSVSTPTATDNCGDANIALNESRNETECGVVIIRTWTATDACGNSSTAQQVINIGLDLDASVTPVSSVVCNGENNGSAEVNTTANNVTYSWDNGETTKVATQLNGGLHSVTVSADNGCQKILTVQISEPEAIIVSVQSSGANCATVALGSASANAGGGTGAYSYAWSNGSTDSSISGLAAGTYSVVVTDANGCTAESSVEISEEVQCDAALGDFVWEDLNRNGIQDVNEPGISGIIVRLYTSNGTQVASATTGSNGMYMFSGLAAGSYYIEFGTPTGFTQTLANRGNNKEEDSNVQNGRSQTINLAEGESNKTIDAGFYQNGSIGNYVWNDLNKDGIQDVDEPGKVNVRVWLFNEDGESIASTFTNDNGAYLFNNIPPGKYSVGLEIGENIVISPRDVGNNDAIDNDVDPSTGRSELFMLNSGQNIDNLDIGCYSDVSNDVIDLELDKSVNNSSPAVDEMVTFTVRVTNSGSSKATGIDIADVLPNGYGNVISISNGGVLNNGIITWTGLSLDVDESIALRYRATISAFQAGLSYKNVAQVTAADQDDVDSTPNNDDGDQSEDDEDFAFVMPADMSTDKVDLELIKRVNISVPQPGEVVSFRLTVSNASQVNATGVAVQDVLPNGFTNITNISNGGSLSGNTITWSGLSINGFDEMRLTYDVEIVQPGAGISYTNVAQVTAADQSDMDSAPNNDDGDQSEDDEDSITTSPVETDLSLTKVVSDMNPDIRDVVTYTLTVINNGPSDATGVDVLDYLPIKYCTEFTNISNGGLFLGETIEWSDLQIPANGSIQLTFDATVAASAFGKDVINLAEITDADQFDPNSTPGNLGTEPVEDDEAMAIFTVGKTSDLELTKTADRDIVDANDWITFTITLRNNGPDRVAYAQVTDYVPDGYTDMVDISHNGKVVQNRVIWDVRDLNAGEVVEFTFEARVVHFLTRECDYKNVAQVTMSTNSDPDSTPGNDDGDQSEDDEASVEPQFILGSSGGCIKINTAVLLEGPYQNGPKKMSTKLNELGYLPGQIPEVFFGIATPSGQPYAATPWGYDGAEGNQFDATLPSLDGAAGYPVNATDWVLVSLRTSPQESSTVCQQAALLLSDGTVMFVDDEACCNLDPTQSYYIVIEHRNHLLVMSHTKLPIANGEISYDFRLRDSYTELVGVGQKNLGDVWVMYAGNGDQVTSDADIVDINVKDLRTWLIDDGLNSSYYLRDFDLNGDVNVQDKGLMLKNNGLFSDVRKSVK